MTRYLIPPLVLMAAAVLLVGCEDGIANLDVENTNDPTRDAVQTAEDFESLLSGATTQAFQVTVSDWGPHMDLLADQTTSTNAFRSFWDFAEEPRLPVNNRSTYATPAIFADPFSNLNAAQRGANRILRLTEVQDSTLVTSNGTDITAKMRASAYLTRGVARGYLGLIYNQAYAVPEDVTALDAVEEAVELSSYDQMIDAAVSDIEQAISIAESNTGDFETWDHLLGNSYNNAEFQTIAHSMAAKISMGEARTRQELESYSDERLQNIIDHAEAGVGGGSPLPSFSPSATSGEFVNSLADWSSFVIGGPAGYLPMDVKVSHLLDPSYPTEYPDDGTLDPHSTPDPRGSTYFFYTDAFGFLSQARNKNLFSNYFRLRNEGGNNWFNFNDVAVSIATDAEMQYLKAEAHLMRGESSDAATALENSPFGTEPITLTNDLPVLGKTGDTFFGAVWTQSFGIGGNGLAAGKSIDAGASGAEFVRALHTEYAVELDLMAGVGAQWYFMRRHDLLQEGTALHYPLPGEEIEVLLPEDFYDDGFYTFGGANQTSQDGTAGGASGSATDWTSWRDFDTVTGVDAPVGFSQDAESVRQGVDPGNLDVNINRPPRAEEQ